MDGRAKCRPKDLERGWKYSPERTKAVEGATIFEHLEGRSHTEHDGHGTTCLPRLSVFERGFLVH